MRATTLVLIACALPLPGSVIAQEKVKPDQKPKTKIAYELTQEDLAKLKADADAFAHEFAARFDHQALKASAESFVKSFGSRLDLVELEAKVDAIAHGVASSIDYKKLHADAEALSRDIAAKVDFRWLQDPVEPRWQQQQQWYQGDPADSLYRAAYAIFGRQQYRQAAERFAEVRAKHPNTRYFCDAAYYEAFSRYRLGTQTDLRTAHRVLDGMDDRCRTGSRRAADVPQLTARVNTALARLGDRDAVERVRRAASEGQNVCDTEERDVKIQALSALAQMDPETATPVLRQVLDSKDPCSAPIRRQAINLVARRNDPEAVTILGRIARSDPNRENQLEAVRALGRVSNETAYRALDEFFRSTGDDKVKLEAARSLARNEDPRAQATVRALVERNDVDEEIRAAVISALASRANTSVEYWRTLYPKLESDELRSSLVYALARNESSEAKAFLISVARNPQESHATREAVLSRIGATAPVADLYKMFLTADTRSMRLSIVRILAGRRESEATDRLIDIAKSGTDPDVRRAAINALGHSHRKDDPRVIKALGEIIGTSR